jgi:hypothetical protein
MDGVGVLSEAQSGTNGFGWAGDLGLVQQPPCPESPVQTAAMTGVAARR